MQSKAKKGENKENFNRNTAAVGRLSTEKFHRGIVNPLTKQKIKERRNIEKNKPRKAKITDFVKFNFGNNGVLKIRKTPEKKVGLGWGSYMEDSGKYPDLGTVTKRQKETTAETQSK